MPDASARRIQSSRTRRAVSLSGLFPDLPQVLLHVVDRRQRLVDAQGLFQPLTLVALGVQVLRVLQQQPARALEHLLVQLLGGLAVQLPAEVAQLLVEQLDDVEVVEDMHGPGQVLADGQDVGRLMSVATALIWARAARSRFQNGSRASAPFAVADEDHRPAHQVEHHRQVAVPLGRRRSRRWRSAGACSAWACRSAAASHVSGCP